MRRDQCKPFVIPASIESLEQAVVDPVEDCLPNVGRPLSGAEIAHTFEGGEESALERAHQLILSGELKDYKETRNMLGNKFSAKLSAFLALGCITARQVHHRLIKFEEGLDSRYESVEGYGGGESPGTESLRSQLLYRDYTRLCAIKAKGSLFRLGGIKGADPDVVIPGRIKDLDKIAETMARVFAGTTGMSLVDASQRELIFTGYTSNRARQIVATYLTRNLGMDWPYGAEMYEALLVDYDVASNWANWQYFAGFGNKAGGSNSRVANPVHQSFKYDKDGSYVRAWLPELAGLVELKYLFQPAMAPKKLLEQLGLHQSPQCVNAVGTISYSELDPRSQRQLEWRKRNRQGARVIRTDEASSSRRSDFHGLWRTWGHDNDGEMSGRGRVEFRLE
ncbi:Cryptochrome/photolyase FAD-binding domain-containing protein [Thozetella sp. PMI_491]|nr:Cryptochrome/photolyase FAD-binding domain-containing protein [Thozetella sp. PMI_491]